jgi:putative serine protease PepD
LPTNPTHRFELLAGNFTVQLLPAGLTAGAVVTKVENQVIQTGKALIAAVQSRAPGAWVTLVFSDTSGNARSIEVKLGTDESRQ